MKKVTEGKRRLKMLVAAALVVGVCGVTGCSGSTVAPGGQEVETDSGKTQLTVATVDAGIGSQWIKDSAARFEEEFKDVSFEEGKKGVQVTVVANSGYRGNNIVKTIKKEAADVWFTELVEYEAHLKEGNFADITDIVTEKLTDYGEDKAIEDKMDDVYREYLNVGTADSPKYYAVPFFDSFYGLSYDKDLFERENLYFKSSGTEAGDAADGLGFVASASDTKSAGVDGKLGTYDDGLPATYAQLLSLIDRMREKDITPFIYAGSNAMDYTMRLMAAFWAQAEGEENYSLNSTLRGTATDLVKMENGNIAWNGDTPALESLEITPDNGYELQRQVGKYYVLELFDTIVANTENYTDSTLLHLDAQTNFLKGQHEDFEEYGMLIDGIWWENEASESMTALASRFGEEYAKENRNLAYMPLPVPKAEDVGRKNVLVNVASSLGFIRSTTDILDCAKAFLQFTTTDAELSAFTASLSITRSLNYELTDEALASMTSFGRSVYELKKSAFTDYGLSTEPVYTNNISHFAVSNWAFGANIEGLTYSNPWQFWLNYSGRYSAEDYFEGLSQRHTLSWKNLIR